MRKLTTTQSLINPAYPLLDRSFTWNYNPDTPLAVESHKSPQMARRWLRLPVYI